MYADKAQKSPGHLAPTVSSDTAGNAVAASIKGVIENTKRFFSERPETERLLAGGEAKSFQSGTKTTALDSKNESLLKHKQARKNAIEDCEQALAGINCFEGKCLEAGNYSSLLGLARETVDAVNCSLDAISGSCQKHASGAKVAKAVSDLRKHDANIPQGVSLLVARFGMSATEAQKIVQDFLVELRGNVRPLLAEIMEILRGELKTIDEALRQNNSKKLLKACASSKREIIKILNTKENLEISARNEQVPLGTAQEHDERQLIEKRNHEIRKNISDIELSIVNLSRIEGKMKEVEALTTQKQFSPIGKSIEKLKRLVNEDRGNQSIASIAIAERVFAELRDLGGQLEMIEKSCKTRPKTDRNAQRSAQAALSNTKVVGVPTDPALVRNIDLLHLKMTPSGSDGSWILDLSGDTVEHAFSVARNQEIVSALKGKSGATEIILKHGGRTFLKV